MKNYVKPEIKVIKVESADVLNEYDESLVITFTYFE